MSVTSSNASELTAEQVQSILIQPLEDASVFLAAGPQIFDGAGPIRLPKLGGPVTDPGWTGESTLIPSRDVGFDEVLLLPSGMKSIKVLTRFSNELARQSVVALDQALQARLVSDVAAKLDARLLSADGDGVTEPQGLFAWAGTQNIDVNAALSLDTLHDAVGLALAANVNPAGLRWFLRPREFTALRKLTDDNGRYQLTPDPTLPGGFTLLGFPVVVTNHIADDAPDTPDTARAALVGMDQVAIGRDLAPSVTILDQTFGDYDEQAIRVVSRYDAKPLNAAAVITMTDITI